LQHLINPFVITLHGVIIAARVLAELPSRHLSGETKEKFSQGSKLR